MVLTNLCSGSVRKGFPSNVLNSFNTIVYHCRPRAYVLKVSVTRFNKGVSGYDYAFPLYQPLSECSQALQSFRKMKLADGVCI